MKVKFKIMVVVGLILMSLGQASIGKDRFSGLNLTDWGCLDRCVDLGYRRSYCQQICEY